ncbi:hypothetical protein OHA21_21740 [Actinoplanes sp. NBC_00393]|uniref:hypothetical protein n=1 Tax=Actinoplanes sp. NBC_00393 TaxID=2975953 RepID=UPI002E21CBE6
MGAGAVIWMIGVVLLGGSALLWPALSAHRRRTPARPAAPAPPKDAHPESVTAERHEVVIDDNGLTVRVRGYAYTTGWTARCALSWPDVVALELDTGTYDSIVSLYATTRTDHFRKHLLDAGAFDRDQWMTLRGIVLARTRGRLRLDLSPLDRP